MDGACGRIVINGPKFVHVGIDITILFAASNQLEPGLDFESIYILRIIINPAK